MNIKAKANGNVIHAHDDAAKQLIDAGIYEATDEPITGSPEALKAAEKRAPVAPMTTDSMPTKKRKAK